MIEFRGDMSDNCKKYIIKIERRISFIGYNIMGLMFAVPAIILSITESWVFSLFLLVSVIFFLYSLSTPKGKMLGFVIPKEIVISTEELTSRGERFCQIKDFSSVKKVVDMGDWYHIYFKFPYMAAKFVCQKDLIVKGTIEEFEKLFEGKIVRKK